MIRTQYKKLAFSLLVVAAVGVTGVSATRALLNDTATLGASTFSTGTVDLKISKDGGSFVDGPVEGFTDTLRPNEKKDFEIWLKNTTPDAVFKLDGKALSPTMSEGIEPGDIKISFTEVNPDGSAMDGGATVSKTITTWDDGDPLGTGFTLAANTAQRYKMSVELDDSAPNGTFSFSFEFTGTQVLPATPTPSPTTTP